MNTNLFYRQFEKFLFLISSVLLSFHFNTFSQSINYNPESPLHFSSDNFIEENISLKIIETKAQFNNNDIEKLKLAISKNNNEVEQNILQIKNELSKVRLIKSEILNLADIEKINEQIKEKKENLEKIKQEIENDLSNISYKGFYIVVLNGINSYEQKEILSSKARKILAPKAIEYLNGVFINSITTVENNITISDLIKSTISGEMSIELECSPTKVIRNTGVFIYMVKVNVSPLKENIDSFSTSINTMDKFEIINLLIDTQYKTKLLKFNFSDEEIKKIEYEYQNSIESIINQNISIEEIKNNIIKKGNISINKILIEIDELNIKYSEKSILLKEIIEKNTSIKFDKNLVNKCIENALSELNEKIALLLNNLLKTKENELIIMQSNVVTQGKPEEDIAKNALSIFSQITKTYNTVEKFIEEVTVEDFKVSNYESIQKSDLIREPENIWLYPTPGNNDNFQLTIIVKFKNAKIEGSFSYFFMNYFSYNLFDYFTSEFNDEILKSPSVKQSKWFIDYINWRNSSHLFNEEINWVTVLSSDSLSFLEKEVIYNNLMLNILDFEKIRTYQLNFKKEKENWFFNGFENTSLNTNKLIDSEFIDFLIKFSNDSVFQINHIKFPLQEISLEDNPDTIFDENYDPYVIINREILKKDWGHWNLNINQLMIFSNLNENSKYRNIHYCGIGNGIWSKITFEKIDEVWQLVKYEDYSN